MWKEEKEFVKYRIFIWIKHILEYDSCNALWFDAWCKRNLLYFSFFSSFMLKNLNWRINIYMPERFLPFTFREKCTMVEIKVACVVGWYVMNKVRKWFEEELTCSYFKRHYAKKSLVTFPRQTTHDEDSVIYINDPRESFVIIIKL